MPLNNCLFLSQFSQLPHTLTTKRYVRLVQNAFCTDHINLPPSDTDERNTICQSSPHLRHIKFPKINIGDIGVLLGTACISFTYALECIRGSANHAFGIRTDFRWTIADQFHVPHRKKYRPSSSLIFYATTTLGREQSLSVSLQLFWNIKKTAVEPQVHHTLNEEEHQALPTLQDTIRHTGGRCEIGLLWKPDASLSNNYFAALSQPRSLQKRLKENQRHYRGSTRQWKAIYRETTSHQSS